jgi:hypothetical protein
VVLDGGLWQPHEGRGPRAPSRPSSARLNDADGVCA